MSMPSPLIWPEADAARVVNNDAFTSAITNNFRTNVSLRLWKKDESWDLQVVRPADGKFGTVLDAQRNGVGRIRGRDHQAVKTALGRD
jgi:hypothetical protein